MKCNLSTGAKLHSSSIKQKRSDGIFVSYPRVTDVLLSTEQTMETHSDPSHKYVMNSIAQYAIRPICIINSTVYGNASNFLY